MTFERRSGSDTLNWVFLLLTLVLAGGHLYLGLVAGFVPGERATQFVLIGLGFLVGVVVYFTSYWRPVLYLLGVFFAIYLGVLWTLGGMEFAFAGVAIGLVATAFALLGIYLFLREERRLASQ